MFDVGDFTISYDLIYAYHRIEIFQENQQYFSYIVMVSFIGRAPGENYQPAASH
jgi:hypothetical protein